MTALTKYKRLESTGLWRDDPQDQRREVIVHLGEATLILTDPRTEVALSHWSLPAISRISPGTTPAIYAPAPDSRETLELSEPEMIAALEKVRAALLSAVPRPGRLRGALVAGVSAALVGIGALWVPKALLSHTALVLPPAKQAEIGQTALEDVIRVTGAPCTEQQGLVALAGLSERLFGPSNTPIVYVMRDGLTTGAHLPGDLILVSEDLLKDAKGPEALAGAILAEAERDVQADPMLDALRYAGLVPTFRLLTSGDLPAGVLTGYGQYLLAQAPVSVSDARLVARFSAAGVPVRPYAEAVLPAGAAREALAAADPLVGTAVAPLMSDSDWLSLQAICGG
jgi:hypothetical protein